MKYILAASIALFTVPAWAGTFTVLPLTGDGDSGISADKAYTHAINVFDGPNLTINGAVFTGSGGGGNPATNNYSTTGLGSGFGSFASGIAGTVGGLFTNFLYDGNPETLTLNNLRVGQQYVSTFYNAAFGPAGERFQTITASDLGIIHFDQNAQPASLLKYAFTATSNTMTFTITPDLPGNTFHQYAFSNEMVGYKALLTDNYFAPSNPNTDDVNFNLAARQGGSLVADGGPISYTDVGNTQVGNSTGGVDGGNYLLGAFGGRSALNFNFNNTYSAGGLSISFDLAPNINGGNSTDWGSIILGASAANATAFVADGVPHLGILFRENGLMEVWDGNSIVTSAPSWGAPAAANALNHFELLLTDPTDQNPFDGVGQTDVAVYANGILVYNFSKGDGGYGDNYVNFGAAAIAGHDNLLIAQVPEPSSFALLALGGLALLRRRR